MHHGSVSEIVSAPSAQVFDLVHDYDKRLRWDTLLSEAFLDDGHSKAEVGATSVCVGRWFLGRLSLKTLYVSFERPRLAAVRMTNSPLLFATWAASIRHEDLDQSRSRVTYTWTFSTKPRILAPLLEPIIGWLFRRETQKRLVALRTYFERP